MGKIFRKAAATAALALTVGSVAAAGTIVGAPAADAAAMNYSCYLKSDQATTCVAENVALRANGTWSRAVTVYTGKHRTGQHATYYVNTSRSGDRCTTRTNDIDRSVWLPAGFRGTVSSIKDFPGRHCDWRLVGPKGGKSTWVQNSWGNLSNLGNGWNNRAVAIQLT